MKKIIRKKILTIFTIVVAWLFAGVMGFGITTAMGGTSFSLTGFEASTSGANGYYEYDHTCPTGTIVTRCQCCNGNCDVSGQEFCC